MQDAVFPTLASQIGALHFLGEHPDAQRQSSRCTESGAVQRVSRPRRLCRDHLHSRGHWRNLVDAMQRPELLDDPRFADMTFRATNMEAVDAVVEAWTRTLDKDEVFRIAQAHDVICAPVQDLHDVLDDPHLHARGMLIRMTIRCSVPRCCRARRCASKASSPPALRDKSCARCGQRSASTASCWAVR